MSTQLSDLTQPNEIINTYQTHCHTHTQDGVNYSRVTLLSSSQVTWNHVQGSTKVGSQLCRTLLGSFTALLNANRASPVRFQVQKSRKYYCGKILRNEWLDTHGMYIYWKGWVYLQSLHLQQQKGLIGEEKWQEREKAPSCSSPWSNP